MTQKVVGSTPWPFHFQVTTLGKLYTHISCHQAVYFGTSQVAVMPYAWEDNRRSGITLVTCHRLYWFIQKWAHGLRKEEEHPTHNPHGA